MDWLLSGSAWLGALFIFAMRVLDMTCDTLRVLFVVRGKKKLSWMLGFIQSAVFIVAISQVLTHLDNPLTVIGYAAGFATGNVVGMYIEEYLAIGHTSIRVVSSRLGSLIAEKLREGGFAVTEIPARGKDGMVTVLNISVLRKDVDRVDTIVLEVDPEAFMTTEDMRPLRRGFWRS
ncbi:MAG: DUF2179 domain-containing protein [Anaerolinea sp.]|nr:DUF2179 domain-containing protein [Anaerolinea sp.]